MAEFRNVRRARRASETLQLPPPLRIEAACKYTTVFNDVLNQYLSRVINIVACVTDSDGIPMLGIHPREWYLSYLETTDVWKPVKISGYEMQAPGVYLFHFFPIRATRPVPDPASYIDEDRYNIERLASDVYMLEIKVPRNPRPVRWYGGRTLIQIQRVAIVESQLDPHPWEGI